MEGFKGRWNSRTVTFLFMYYCVLLYVLLFFLMIKKMKTTKHHMEGNCIVINCISKIKNKYTLM